MNFTCGGYIWDNYFKGAKVEEMPWYEKNLDSDLENEIKSKSLNTGSFLDLGTSAGMQAIQLAKYDFKVTGTDISPSAIKYAKKLSNNVNFLVDDIIDSKLSDKEFDFIFDRGVFHIFGAYHRPQYVQQVNRILKNNGILFLKCMSDKEKNLPDDDEPYKLSEQEIIDSFKANFDIQRIDDTMMYSFNAKALFVVLKKK